nr:unnamed protein product [Spirometra erinaceieuropaei]
MMPRLVASKQIGDYRYEKYDLSGGSKPKKKPNSQPVYFPAHSDDGTSSDDSNVYQVQKRTILRQRKPVATSRDSTSLCPIHGGTDRSNSDPTYFDRVLECPDTETEAESTDGQSYNQTNRRRPEPSSDDEISTGRHSRNSDWQSEQETRPRRNERRPTKQEVDNDRRKSTRCNHSAEPDRNRGKANRYRDESEGSEEERSPRQVQRQRKPVRKERRDYEEESEEEAPPRSSLKQRKPAPRERRDNEEDSEVESPRRQAQRRYKPALKTRRDYDEEYEEEAYRISHGPTKSKKPVKAQSREDTQYQKKPVKPNNRAYNGDNDFEEDRCPPRKKDPKPRKQAEPRREPPRHEHSYEKPPARPPVKSADRPRKPKRDYVEERTTSRSEYQYGDLPSASELSSESTDSSNDSMPPRRTKPPQRSERRFEENTSQRRRPRERVDERESSQRRVSMGLCDAYCLLDTVPVALENNFLLNLQITTCRLGPMITVDRRETPATGSESKSRKKLRDSGHL